MVNIIVAFGITDNSYFIASGSQYYKNELPTRMDTAVASASVSSPYHFASIGHGGRFFISGGYTCEFLLYYVLDLFLQLYTFMQRLCSRGGLEMQITY